MATTIAMGMSTAVEPSHVTPRSLARDTWLRAMGNKRALTAMLKAVIVNNRAGC